MRVRLLAACLALAGCLAGAGCTGTGAPDGLLPRSEESLRDVYGCWIELDGKELEPGRPGGRGPEVEGEFLAVTEDTVYVLTASTLIAVDRLRIERARLVTFEPAFNAVTGLGAAGMLSTASHGLGLIFSLPIWILTTVGTHSAAKSEAIAIHPRQPWSELNRFARFPQGPPPGLRALGLRARSQVPEWKSAVPEPARGGL